MPTSFSPIKKDHFRRRSVMMVAGILIMGLGVALFKLSGMGNDPYTAMDIAIADCIGIDFAVGIIMMNCLVFALEFALGKEMVGVGTFVNWFGVGPLASLSEKVIRRLFLLPDTLFMRLFLMILGVLVLSFSCALYQTADLGVSPYDSSSIILSKKTKIPYFWCRILTDGICVTTAVLLHGTVGIGTLVCALGMGPVVHFFTRNITMKILNKT